MHCSAGSRSLRVRAAMRPAVKWLRRAAAAAFLLSTPAGQALAGPSHLAVIISADRYEQLPDLPNAAADATLVAAALRKTGYRTVELAPRSRSGLLRQLARLRIAASDASQVVVYYAGHGLQSGGRSFLLLPGVQPAAGRWQQESLSLDVVLRAFSDKPRQKIILFDACRTLPELALLPVPATAGNPLPAGVLLAYASQAGAPAWDGGGSNGPFAAAFASGLQRGHTAFVPLLRHVRVKVVAKTAGLQVPWSRSALLRAARFPAIPKIAPAGSPPEG